MDSNSFEICTTNVHQHAQAGALLVDVREHNEAQALAFDAPGDGEKSALASQFLREKGFLDVSPMRGGILLWMQNGYPVIGTRCNSFDKEQEQ